METWPRVEEVAPILRGLRRKLVRRDDFDVSPKRGRGNLVTSVDFEVEAALMRDLPALGFGGVLVSEEAGVLKDPQDETGWVLDPIDGTQNFAHGVPCIAVSIAWVLEGAVSAGFVYDPWLDELFSSLRGKGSTCNGIEISPSTIRDLPSALLATGIPYDRHRLDDFFELTRMLAEQTEGYLIKGPASLDLCYVAAGRFDGYIEFDLESWDIAAGKLILEEAGGVVKAFGPPESGSIVASNPLIAEALSKLGAAVF